MREKRIQQFTTDGQLVATWESATAVQDTLGWCKTGISACCLGKVKTSHGYVWGFEDKAAKNNAVKPVDKEPSPYTTYVKQLYGEYRDYDVEDEFAKSIAGAKLTELPRHYIYWLTISRKFTMYNARNLMYHCNEPNVRKLLRYLEDVEMEVAAATCKMRDWRGVVDAVMRTIAEEWRDSLPVCRAGKRNCIPVAALHPETLEPLMVFNSTLEAVGVTGNMNVMNAMKFGSTVAGVKWQKHADYLAGKPIVREKRPRDKPYEVNPFETGVESLV
jgi:hypothetical protein